MTFDEIIQRLNKTPSLAIAAQMFEEKADIYEITRRPMAWAAADRAAKILLRDRIERQAAELAKIAAIADPSDLRRGRLRLSEIAAIAAGRRTR